MVTFILRTAQERMRSMKERRTKNPLRGRPGHVATARCRGLSRDRIARRRSRVHCVGVAEANVDGREIKVGRHDCAGPYRARSSRSMRVLTSRVRRFGENRSPISRRGVNLTPGMASPAPTSLWRRVRLWRRLCLAVAVVFRGLAVFGAVVVVRCRNRPVTTDRRWCG
jgi:hypothetical protein